MEHDLALSWLFRLSEQRDINLPTYLITYLLTFKLLPRTFPDYQFYVQIARSWCINYFATKRMHLPHTLCSSINDQHQRSVFLITQLTINNHPPSPRGRKSYESLFSPANGPQVIGSVRNFVFCKPAQSPLERFCLVPGRSGTKFQGCLRGWVVKT